MIKMMLKCLWAQRKSNLLLFAELCIVGILLFYTVDVFASAVRCYLIPSGFNVERCYLIKVSPRKEATSTANEIKECMDRFLKSRSEVETFAYTYFTEPYSSGYNTTPLLVNGKQEWVSICHGHEEFASIFNFELLKGRWFSKSEVHCNEKVCVITENLSTRLGRKGGIGETLVLENDNREQLRIVGVVRDVKYKTYLPAESTVFRPMELQYMNFGFRVIVKIKKGQEESFARTLDILENEVGQAMQFNIAGVNDFETKKSEKNQDQDNILSNLFWCSSFFLFNVVLGIYVVFSGRIKKRVQELGLRMAVGSSRMGIIGLVLGEATMLLLLSSIPVLVVGGNLAYFGMLSPDSSLTVSRFVTVFLLTELILLVSVLFSVLLPAVRASKVQPAEALHYE